MWRHPLKWTVITVVTLVVGIIVGHLGPLFVTGCYDVITQSFRQITDEWNKIPTDIRHGFLRNYQEFFVGGMIFQFIGWNAFSAIRWHLLNREPGWLLRPITAIERVLHIPTLRNVRNHGGLKLWQIPYGFLVSEVYGLAGFFIVVGINAAIHHSVADLHFLSASSSSGTVAQLQNIDLSSKLSHIEGLVASFIFGRRAMAGVFDGVQLWFAERHYGKTVGFGLDLLLPHYAARCNWVDSEVKAGRCAIPKERHGHGQGIVLGVCTAVFLALCAYGYEVLTYHHVLVLMR